MSGASAAALAEQVDVDRTYIDRLVELGILVPGDDGLFSETAERAVHLVRTLEGSGLTVDAIGEAVRGGLFSFDFLGLPIYERFSGATGTTFREMSRRTGIPLELLLVVREASGFALAQPDDRMRDYELEAVPVLQVAHASGYEGPAIERLLRVYGEGLRRMAETESDGWLTQVVRPRIEAGMTEREAIEEASRFGQASVELLDRALVGLHHGHQGHVWARTFYEQVERALEQAGLRRAIDRRPAMCFLDLSGYTQLTDARGDMAGAEMAADLARIVQRATYERGGQIVKWLGDGVMLVFEAPPSAVLAALEIVERVPAAGLPPAHAGLDAGPVIVQDGDYFGRTVNIASRVSVRAAAGEVLVTDTIVQACDDLPGVAFDATGPASLRGVANPVTLHRARRAEAPRTDP